jgi:phosphoribosylamine-glycine ligase
MMAGEDTLLCSAGSQLGIATGTGPSVREAARGAYRVLNKFSMPASPFWRVDIGQRLRRELPKLQEHGFAVGLEY